MTSVERRDLNDMHSNGGPTPRVRISAAAAPMDMTQNIVKPRQLVSAF
jgi:hypothetical protein